MNIWCGVTTLLEDLDKLACLKRAVPQLSEIPERQATMWEGKVGGSRI